MFDDRELEFAQMYASDYDLDVEVCRQQLRALWTAYCLHKNYACDTRPFDYGLMDIWELLPNEYKETEDWRDFTEFDYYMGALLC